MSSSGGGGAVVHPWEMIGGILGGKNVFNTMTTASDYRRDTETERLAELRKKTSDVAPPPPTSEDERVQEAGRRAAPGRGRTANMLTGGQGLINEPYTTAKKSLLGA